MILRIQPGTIPGGRLRPPGDKSISHRALLLGALAHSETRIRGLLDAEDIIATARCLREMGVAIWEEQDLVRVEGRGDSGLTQPTRLLDAGNSGTTLRLLMGVIASYPIHASISGDATLQRRPMDRVAIPLRQMGAEISGQGERCLPPVSVQGIELKAISYQLPMASAQVKSAILLAGLRAPGETRITEPGPSRDHTERMLRQFGVKVETGPGFASLVGGQPLQAQQVTVPGDFSAAAFFMVAGAIVEGADIEIENVGLNPTRTGLLEVLQEMGADIQMQIYPGPGDAEPVGRLRIRGNGALRGGRIGGSLIPRLIDELPILCIAAACAQGETIIADAQELRVKESDRIAVMAGVLAALGVPVQESPDGLSIQGGARLQPARIDSRGDHRIAMSGAIAGLVSPYVEITGAEAIATSYPAFTETLGLLGAQVEVVK
jgi:3-phosphoshikimate 1-carboxyvinyltransferase